MKTKVLILYTAIGIGHKIMGENIGHHLEKAGYEVRFDDIVRLQQNTLTNISTAIHRFINSKLPFVWSWMYKSKLVNYVATKLRLKLAARNHKATLNLINEFQPDLVIAVQTTASSVISYLRKAGLYKNRFAIGFSDFHIHPLWLYPDADFYLVNIQEQKDEMIKAGYNADHIYVCGMTALPPIKYDANEVITRLQLKPNVKTLLLASGSQGIGFANSFMDQMLSELDKKLGEPYQAIIVCGKSQEFYDYCISHFDKSKVRVLGFYKPMSELYSISDIFVTKPGGLSTTESLSYYLPMSIIQWLPGQEELNIKYLTQKELIMPGVLGWNANQSEMIDQIITELKDGKFRQKLKQNPNVKLIVDIEAPGQKAVDAVNREVGNEA